MHARLDWFMFLLHMSHLFSNVQCPVWVRKWFNFELQFFCVQRLKTHVSLDLLLEQGVTVYGLITEVKQPQAWLILGWVTIWDTVHSPKIRIYICSWSVHVSITFTFHWKPIWCPQQQTLVALTRVQALTLWRDPAISCTSTSTYLC